MARDKDINSFPGEDQHHCPTAHDSLASILSRLCYKSGLPSNLTCVQASHLSVLLRSYACFEADLPRSKFDLSNATKPGMIPDESGHDSSEKGTQDPLMVFIAGKRGYDSQLVKLWELGADFFLAEIEETVVVVTSRLIVPVSFMKCDAQIADARERYGTQLSTSSGKTNTSFNAEKDGRFVDQWHSLNVKLAACEPYAHEPFPEDQDFEFKVRVVCLDIDCSWSTRCEMSIDQCSQFEGQVDQRSASRSRSLAHLIRHR